MYRCLIIDDEPLARTLIAMLLKSFPQITVAAECGDGFEGIKAIQEHTPDLVFLDVQMPRLTGFEMLELVDAPPAVIFTTAYDQYALQAFERSAVDYLLKPVTRERFDKAVNKWLATAGEKTAPTPVTPLLESLAREGFQQRIVVKDNSTIRIIPVTDIQYLEASDDYIKIKTAERTYLKKSTLGHQEKQLDPKQFVRVHRSYIIPVSALAKIEPYEKDSHLALLHTGAKIPVSKSGMARLKEVLGW